MPFGTYRLKYSFTIYFFIFLSISEAFAQIPVSHFNKEDFHSTFYSSFENNKEIPNEIKVQTLIALSFYPELNDVKIIFRFRKRTTPLTSRPRLLSTFKRKINRTYVITISTKTNENLTPILFLNLPFNAQIGVLGHELGHIVEYKNKSTFQLIGIPFNMLNTKYTNRLEFNTDLICINHGLGYQLYDWSSYVRGVLRIPEWQGASIDYSNKETLDKQRYMNPETIKKYMVLNFIYQNVK